MKFGYAIVYVKDVEQTIDFYERAFGFKQKFITVESDYAELISGETTIAFASIELGSSNFQRDFLKSDIKEKPLGVEFAFVSENVEEDYKKAVQAGATEFEPLTQKPWGQKVGYVRDNNGFLVEICSPINN